ncbi:MAG: hypothetical protein ACTSVH_08310 [Candidatus Heimdallarchaeota archaeon]
MRSITLRYAVLMLVIILVVGNSSLINVEGKDLENCETALTDLTWNDYVDPTNASNTCFDFDIEFQFFNPNGKDVTLNFPDSVPFVVNMTIEFENTSLVAYEVPLGSLPVLTNLTYELGVTTDNVNYNLTIEEPGLTELPDGNYTIWVYDNRTTNTEPVVVYHKTLLVIVEGVITIDYGTIFYTWPFGGIYSVIFFSALMVTAIAMKFKKKLQRRK